MVKIGGTLFDWVSLLAEKSKLFAPFFILLLGYSGYSVYSDISPIVKEKPVKTAEIKPEPIIKPEKTIERVVETRTIVDNSAIDKAIKAHIREYH